MKHISLKKVLMSFLAIAFPWVVLLIDDNPGGALITLVLQATIIGWLPASAWAWKIVHGSKKKKPSAPKKNMAS